MAFVSFAPFDAKFDLIIFVVYLMLTVIQKKSCSVVIRPNNDESDFVLLATLNVTECYYVILSKNVIKNIS